MKKHLKFLILYSLWAGSIIWVLGASQTTDGMPQQEGASPTETCDLKTNDFTNPSGQDVKVCGQ